MENNEQLTQNPAIEEGIENETTTSKASKKAIDGNEKKKIVKLIQPSILPGKVRIEVNTLMDEATTEPAPAVDEVMPEMMENPELDEEELVEDNADLDGLNKLQLVEMLEELVQDIDIQKIKDKVKEEDPKLTPSLNLRTILGGDFLTAEMVRRQIWLIVLMVLFTIIYVASRYQCQQDLIAIDKLEKELLHAKYKALSSSSTLTEKCRESHVLEALKQNKDSLLHISDQPPYIINVPE